MPNLSIYFIYKKDLFPQIDSPYTLGMASSDIVPIPLPTIRRLPHYLQALRKRLILKEEFTSTTLLAEYLHLKAIQVRKDMNYTGIEGRRKLGYHTASLVTAIEEILGIRNFKEAVLVGVGNLGSALLKYSGLNSGELTIGAAFDLDPQKVGQTIGATKVQPLSALSKYIKNLRIKIAILSVPSSEAQQITDDLVRQGIKGIWNFTSAYLKVPEDVVVRREDLLQNLASLQAEVLHRG
jgi:redox-sensing transcriptional repressor